MKLHVLSATILLLIMTAAVRANDKPNTVDSIAAFAQLKSLAGDWESKAPDGKKSYAREALELCECSAGVGSIGLDPRLHGTQPAAHAG